MVRRRVVVGRELAVASPHGPFWLILNSVGGAALAAALGMLQPNGACVTFGVSETSTANIESREFFATGGARLYGLTLFHELMSVERAGIGLGLLAELIAAGKLRPKISVDQSSCDATDLIPRRSTAIFAGKAVLHI